jgi:cell growth-regulating nucleolar protein
VLQCSCGCVHCFLARGAVSFKDLPMVFFVCDGCNETLKKNQVDKHAGRCRTCYSVTCVDCNQTFPGDEYVSHVTCVTEAEKYQKTLYQQKKSTKLNPQELWAMTIQEAVTNVEKAPKNIQHFIPMIAECGNVPRNKNKFINFAKNSLRLNSLPILESIWNFLETFKSTPATPTAGGAAAAPSETIAVATTEDTEEKQQKDLKQNSKESEAPEKKKKKKKSSDSDADIAVVAPVEQSQEVEPLNDVKEKKKKKNKVREEEEKVAVEKSSSEKKKKRKLEKSVEEEETKIEAKEKKSKKKSKVE